MDSERGQSTVEWLGTLAVVALMLVAGLAAGAGLPGAPLARVVASRILCAAAIADGCGDEPALIAAYGSELGKLVRQQMPALVFEPGSDAVPVDFRRCRETACGDSSEAELVHGTDQRLPVTAFVHVIDCRPGSESEGADCSGERGGNLYLQYWTYYADSATLRGVPVVGEAGFHRDDWESVQIRIGSDGQVEARASSHSGYNYSRSAANWGSDAGSGAARRLAEMLGVRERNGWGPATGMVIVSGGSHAGNARALAELDRFTPGRRVHLVPLEPIAAGDESRFAVNPPWNKQVWHDPEA
jgi:hypothetical protein